MTFPSYYNLETPIKYKQILPWELTSELVGGQRSVLRADSTTIHGLWPYRSSATVIGLTPGACFINGIPRYVNTALTHTFTTPTDGHWLDIWVGADGTSPFLTMTTLTNGATTPATVSTNPYTNGRRVASILYKNGTDSIMDWRSYRGDSVHGWFVTVGDDANTANVTLLYGVTFQHVPITRVYTAGGRNSATGLVSPTAINQVWAGASGYPHIERGAATTTQIGALARNALNFSSSASYAWYFVAEGSHLNIG